MGFFDIFRSGPSQSSIQAGILAYCPMLVSKARESVQRRLGSRADSFDYDMAAYTSLGALLTFVAAHLSDETRSHPITMAVLDYGSQHGIQRQAIAVTHARLKVNFESGGKLSTLASDIQQDLSLVSPEHSLVFQDIAAEIQAHVGQLLPGRAA